MHAATGRRFRCALRLGRRKTARNQDGIVVGNAYSDVVAARRAHHVGLSQRGVCSIISASVSPSHRSMPPSYKSPDQRVAAGYILTGIRNLQWQSRLTTQGDRTKGRRTTNATQYE